MAIEFFLHVVPGGTVGINPVPAGTPHELITHRPDVALALDWEIFANAPATCVNAVDVARGLVGWRVGLPLASVTADTLSGVGIHGTISGGVYFSTPHFPPMAALFSGAAVGAAAELFGYYFMETDFAITDITGVVINPASTQDFGFFMSPSWCSGSLSEHYQGTSGFGLVWSPRLNSNNWHLYIADADTNDNYFALADTGVNAIDGSVHHLRVEWGYDITIAKPIIRGLIDGVIKAEFVGPFTLDDAFELGAFSQGACVGLDLSDVQPLTVQLAAFFGMGTGIRIGGFLIIPPTPPVPPVVVFDQCSVVAPIFVDEAEGLIGVFDPCSGTGQQIGAGNCG